MSDCSLCRLYSEEVRKAESDVEEARRTLNRAFDGYAFRHADGTYQSALARSADARDQLIRHKEGHLRSREDYLADEKRRDAIQEDQRPESTEEFLERIKQLSAEVDETAKWLDEHGIDWRSHFRKVE